MRLPRSRLQSQDGCSFDEETGGDLMFQGAVPPTALQPDHGVLHGSSSDPNRPR